MATFRSIVVVAISSIIFFLGGFAAVFLFIISFGKSTNAFIKYYGMAMGKSILWGLGIKLNVIHEQRIPDSPGIYIFNHRSTLDIPIMIALGLKNIRFVAKKEFLYNPVFALVGWATGQIFIDRKNSIKAKSSLKKSYARIKKGNLSLLIAPEGTRKHKEPIGRFKRGAFWMARDLDYPIIPIFSHDPFALSPVDNLKFKPGTITVEFHESFKVTNCSDDEIADIITQTREKYQRWYNEAIEKDRKA